MMINAERAFDALGEPTRRLVLKRLRSGSLSVREIADGMEISRPAVSQHLRVLKEAGLVAARSVGTRRLYAIDGRGIEALRGWLDGVWDDALAAFAKAAEQQVMMKAGDRDDTNANS